MTKKNDSHILVVGSLAFDTIQTPAGKADLIIGGAANHFAIAASFYAPISIVAVVGQDFPQTHLSWLKEKNIDVSGVKIDSGKTFHWVGSYDTNLNEAKTLATFLNVFEHFEPQLNVEHSKIPYVFLGNIDPTLQSKVLNQTQNTALTACDSMNFWITGKLPELKETLKQVDLLSINEGEAYLLSGKKNLLAASREIQAMGPKILVIKRGEYGAVLVTPQGNFLAPAFLVEEVIDPTGAGDTFAGALLGYLAENKIHRSWIKDKPQELEKVLRRAVLAGCVMASFTVEDFGTKRLMRLTHSELVSRQHELISMIHLG